MIGVSLTIRLNLHLRATHTKNILCHAFKKWIANAHGAYVATRYVFLKCAQSVHFLCGLPRIWKRTDANLMQAWHLLLCFFETLGKVCFFLWVWICSKRCRCKQMVTGTRVFEPYGKASIFKKQGKMHVFCAGCRMFGNTEMQTRLKWQLKCDMHFCAFSECTAKCIFSVWVAECSEMHRCACSLNNATPMHVFWKTQQSTCFLCELCFQKYADANACECLSYHLGSVCIYTFLKAKLAQCCFAVRFEKQKACVFHAGCLTFGNV